MAVLDDFRKRTGARGRFIALYLGMRRMGGDLATIGSAGATPSSEIEEFMDELLTKTHRPEPLVVLTAPFGGSTSPTAPYSTRSGEFAPGNSFRTNTWRNNLGIQKGIGCPADPEVIRANLADPLVRLACPHMTADPEGRHSCAIESTSYRGEEHSIWLRKTPDGWQVADLDNPHTYEEYLSPRGQRIPVFALIAMLYVASTANAYPKRASVGIPEFASDFGFSQTQVEALFECDPSRGANAAVLRAAQQHLVVSRPRTGLTRADHAGPREPDVQRLAGPLPDLIEPALRNSGVEAELDVAEDLAEHGWVVAYRGAQTGVGYDLEAEHSSGSRLRVEVKSSVGFTTPELTESEWEAAQRYGDEFVLALVDFVGSPSQALWYVQNPAATVTPLQREGTIFRLPRADLADLRTEADYL
ncbi:DUF3883 domain-containing protein [Thermoleophilia bacterium SCSIO 60948]|nr:DUF3883 domain-containing protein [Thermoleophilia bacterium SCSIO 60948]